MTEQPRPRLALVDRAMAELPEDSPARAEAVRKVLTRHAPNIAKLAKAEAKAEMLTALGVQALEEASQLATLRQERDARPTAAELAHARSSAYWRGSMQWGLLCFAGGVVGACALVTFIIVPFNEQTRASTEAGVMIGTATRTQSREPMTELPRYEHGRREPGDAPQ